MARVNSGLRIDEGLKELIDARVAAGAFGPSIRNRSQFLEVAARAFLAHDAGVAGDLASVVRRFLITDLSWVDEQALEADARRALRSFEARCRS